MPKNTEKLPVNQVIQGDCLEVLKDFPDKSVDLIFADPPYNLQLNKTLWRPNQTRVDAVDDDWDQFQDFEAYDEFSRQWLTACKRVLKPNGTIWVIGTYHNIYRIGSIMQDLGYWFLNDIIWIKSNPMPNFRGIRFTNAHEILIWAGKKKGKKYTFNYHAMKSFNEEKQMRSDWFIPRILKPEKIRNNGRPVHSTQKPEALLYRVILSSTRADDIILDPFFGTGTTGAVARRLHRRWIGIESEEEYVSVARQRIEAIEPEPYDRELFDLRDKKRIARRMPFVFLVENGYLQPGQEVRHKNGNGLRARIMANGHLELPDFSGTIHQTARHMAGGRPSNGWDVWMVFHEEEWQPISVIRSAARAKLGEEE